VPYFPRLPFKINPKWDAFARVPAEENPWGYPILHPKYFVFPKLGMRWYGDWLYRGARDAVRALHARKPIDVIDGHYVYPDGTASVRMAAELGIPVVLSARGTDLNFYTGIKPIVPLLRKNIAASTHLICVSSDLRNYALGIGTDAKKISVVGNGIEPSIFFQRDQMECRKALGIPLEGKLLVGVGRLTEVKGHHISIEALARLGRPDVRLAVIGVGVMKDELLALARKLGVADRVSLLGGVVPKNLPAWYNAADAFVLPTSREGWPNVVCESLACGLPIITTTVSGIPEIVTEPWLGILLGDRKAETFAAAMGKALDTPWDRKRIAGFGGRRTWENVADQLEPIFQAAHATGKSRVKDGARA
jgi:teichuronic acid biosynthesis glycosyltransferase TuaC